MIKKMEPVVEPRQHTTLNDVYNRRFFNFYPLTLHFFEVSGLIDINCEMCTSWNEDSGAGERADCRAALTVDCRAVLGFKGALTGDRSFFLDSWEWEGAAEALQPWASLCRQQKLFPQSAQGSS
jgi:hypothetical protein